MRSGYHALREELIKQGSPAEAKALERLLAQPKLAFPIPGLLRALDQRCGDLNRFFPLE